MTIEDVKTVAIINPLSAGRSHVCSASPKRAQWSPGEASRDFGAAKNQMFRVLPQGAIIEEFGKEQT
jgi:hypothetical protein